MLKKASKRIRTNPNAIPLVIFTLFIIFILPKVMPMIAQAQVNATVRYGNCKIMWNFTGDIYLCKKNK